MDIKNIIVGMVIGGLVTISIAPYETRYVEMPAETPRVGSIDQEKARKKELMSDYVWQTARLKEDPVIDLAIGTSEEWSQAYVSAALEQGADIEGENEVININTRLQERAAALSKLCSDPNSSADAIIR